MVRCAGIYYNKQGCMDEMNVTVSRRTKEKFCERRENKPGRLMMTVGVLRGSTTYRDPKTSPAPSMFDHDMRIGAVNHSGRCGR
jgi:hypothetical protein